jgi:hypothetical protein
MAGRNVVTTVQDASAVRDYARAHQIGFIGFWSLGRTTGTARGRLTRAPDAAASPRTPTPSPARFGEPDPGVGHPVKPRPWPRTESIQLSGRR